jgi:hypothetical protein
MSSRELPPFRCMALFALRFFAIGDSAFKSLNRTTMNEGSAAIRLRPDLCDDKSSLRTSASEPEGSPMPHQCLWGLLRFIRVHPRNPRSSTATPSYCPGSTQQKRLP